MLFNNVIYFKFYIPKNAKNLKGEMCNVSPCIQTRASCYARRDRRAGPPSSDTRYGRRVKESS